MYSGLCGPDASAVDHYDITRRNIAQIYSSPYHYGHAFDELFDYMGSATTKHPTAGLVLNEKDFGSLFGISPLAPHAQKYPNGKQAYNILISCLSMILLYLLLQTLQH